MATANRPKAHHKVPRFYLNGFTDPELGTDAKAKLWVYRFGVPEPRPMKPSRVAVENHFNSIITPSGEHDPGPEERLARMEGEVAAVWPALVNPRHVLTEQERAKIAVFIAFFFTRTSHKRMLMDNWVDKVKKMSLRIMSTRFDTLDPQLKEGLTKEDMLEAAEQERLVGLSHNEHVRGVFEGVDDFAPLIFGLRWKVLHFQPVTRLVTSDNPLSMFDPDVVGTHRGVGLMNRNVEVVLPLHRSCCLFMSWRGLEGHFPIADVLAEQLNLAEQVNIRTVNTAIDEVYSPIRSEWLRDFVAGANNGKSDDECP